MKTPDYASRSSRELLDIAQKDVSRVHHDIYKRLGFYPHGFAGLPKVELTDSRYRSFLRSKGPEIESGMGYDVFRGSYLAAENALYQEVKKFMQPGDVLDLDLFYFVDPECAVWPGVTLHWRWQLRRKVA